MTIQELVGKTFTKITDNRDELIFENENEKYRFYHSQDCCESVSIEDINGNLEDLLNTPILVAEEETSRDKPKESSYGSWTWTFYKFATVNGWVTVRWYGESNGYYSESVDFEKVR